jgi:acetyl-CoA carboxylase carboxyl transferase subunit alpha
MDAVMIEAEKCIADALKEFEGKDGAEIKRQRREKFLAIGRNL